MKSKAIVLALVMGLPMAAAAKEVDEIKSVSADGLVKIKNLRGEIEIEGWDEDQVRVRGDLDELATGLRFEVRGTETQIEVKMPRRDVNWGDGSDLVIMVPEQSRIAVDAVSTDVTAKNILGGVRMRTVSGDIELNRGEQNISLQTVSGGISTQDTKGDLRARSSSGEIELRTHQGNADVETMSGELDLDVKGAQRLRGSTISGEIEVDASFAEGTQSEFASVSGEINIEIDQPNNLTIFANTVSGDIRNALTKDKVKEAFGQTSLNTSIGDGSGTLSVRAVSGAIDLDEG